MSASATSSETPSDLKRHREMALQMANTFESAIKAADPASVVTRAQAYYDFLISWETAPKPALTIVP
jgi:hypothetical protein